MRIVDRFLVRAPLLPVGGDLEAAPLGRQALELASPSLVEGLERGDPSARASLSRYAARAAFRATPHGLLAGVGIGRIGDATHVQTGTPEAHLTVGYARLASLARRLLDDPPARAEARLRVAPSLLRHGDHILWLGPDGDALEAVVDDVLAPVLAAAERWARFGAVAAAAGSEDLVLELVDDALLVSDLVPPLVGPPPLEWLKERLAKKRSAAARALHAELSMEPARHATLVFPRAEVTLDRGVVERAARLAPTLVRLAAALAPPTAERELDAGIAAAVDAAVEDFGPGALDLAALALGGYGVRPEAAPAPRPAPPTALITLLVDRFGVDHARFTAEELDDVLPEVPLPPTLELQLAPRAEPFGWLLGWHAPAGATWGRFAHALPAVADALQRLARVEPPGRLDVAFAPEPALADLATHPPIRATTLALTGWPDGPATTPAELGLAAPEMALQGGTPSPLTRLRSTTAPPGVYQLLVGWSLHRQHAPWALTLGPLAQLARLPRVSIDGFVVAPASWRLPTDRSSLAGWRAAGGVPRHVQVGHEDELLPVDLDAPDAAAALAGHDRVVEIWPPLDETPVDADGRRVEVVVAVLLDEPPAPKPRARIPPPSEEGPEPGWRSLLLHGPRDRQDRVLVELVAPVIAAARQRREIDAWFYLRYAEGARHELRLRARGELRRFEDRLARALGPAVAAGDVTRHTLAPFFPERARYGAELAAVLDAFEAGSDLAVALLLDAEDLDVAAVQALDAQAAALGLNLRERHDLAATLRTAEAEPDGAAEVYRRHARALRAALGAPAAGPFRLRSLRRARAHAADLSHLLVNRLVGIDADREAFAYVAWQRTLEGLLAKPLR